MCINAALNNNLRHRTNTGSEQSKCQWILEVLLNLTQHGSKVITLESYRYHSSIKDTVLYMKDVKIKGFFS